MKCPQQGVFYGIYLLFVCCCFFVKKKKKKKKKTEKKSRSAVSRYVVPPFRVPSFHGLLTTAHCFFIILFALCVFLQVYIGRRDGH